MTEHIHLVNGPRQDAYGHPLDNFTRAGRMWAAILGVDTVTPEQVALCMAAMKIARECHRHTDDNVIDYEGYMATIPMIRDERAARSVSGER